MTGYFTLFGEQSIFFLLLIMFKQDKRKKQERKQLRENLKQGGRIPAVFDGHFFPPLFFTCQSTGQEMAWRMLTDM